MTHKMKFSLRRRPARSGAERDTKPNILFPLLQKNISATHAEKIALLFGNPPW